MTELGTIVTANVGALPDEIRMQDLVSIVGAKKFSDFDMPEMSARTLIEQNPAVLFLYLARWCPDCVPEVADIDAVAREYDIQVVGREEYKNPAREQLIHEVPFPLVDGKSTMDDLRGTAHAGFRYAIGDDRKAGVPLGMLVMQGQPNAAVVCMGNWGRDRLKERIEMYL
ncbi:MAG: hypothetical protein OXR66_04815 [Candidatus Woesearchaeota archaeon]|nr:hypothetical protein [Candidatus Woesearchaeota archaeon]